MASIDGENNLLRPQEDQQTYKHLANYQFSSDEYKALRECDYEAFLQRSLPIGTGLSLAAYYAVKNGYLKGSAKWGAVPKVLVGAIVGYFIGKLSYQRKCAEKIMLLPNSKLAEILKMKRKGGLYENFTPDQGFGASLSLAPFSSASDQYSDEVSKSTSLNLDTERPILSGLDDTHRPNVDGNATTFDDELPLRSPKHQTTYDELRQRNHDEYAKKNQNPYYQPVPPETPPVIRSNEKPTNDTASEPRGPKNKYGDVWT